jgi:hypothetical protein
MSVRSAALSVLAVVIVGCSHAPPETGTVVQQGVRRDPANGISAAALRRDLFIFADDSFRGRETGTPDAQRAAAFLAKRVQQLGLEPAGDSLYMQRVPMVRQTFARTTQFSVSMPNGQRQMLRLGFDLAPVLSFGDALPQPSRLSEGEVLFVGYGPMDDASTAALLRYEPAGKIIVAVHGAPLNAKAPEAERLNSQQSLGLRIGHLMALRPAAIIMLMAGTAEPLYDQLSPQLLHAVSIDTRDEVKSDTTQLPMVLLGVARRGSPLLPSRWPNDAAAQVLTGHFNGRVDIAKLPFTGYNVAAVVRGHDPKLNKTYLAFGAHYDHIGIVHTEPHRGRRTTPDSIANGADDDGSGSVALLAIAQQMMIFRPRRSVLFVWHVGEEKGMLGSSYFTDHPTVPIDSIVTQFNADMIGRNSTNTVALIGPRAAPNYQSWRVGMIVDSVNRTLESPFRIDRTWDDPDDPEHIYQRSDHYNYAKKGIPIIFFTSGLHDDYHRVTDEPGKIDYDKLARVARLMLEAGLAVANRSSRPTSEALTHSVSSRQ